MKHEVVIIAAEFSEDAKKIQRFAKDKAINLDFFGPGVIEGDMYWQAYLNQVYGVVWLDKKTDTCYFVERPIEK